LATSTRQQLLDRPGIRMHCHINAMGSFRPDHRELGSDLMADGEVFLDTRDGCLEEAGDVLVPIAEGRLSPDALRPLWDASEASRHRLTILKSVGAASFDIACAARVARELRLCALSR
jgi:ornithine cyclodeaminase/alanine dehydrogenase-like protein (mu-crystallin family)